MTASTRTFYRVTAQRTITIIPDTPAKRREYQEVGRPHLLSEQRRHQGSHRPAPDRRRHPADLPITATNAISLKDTPERIAAAAKLIAAIDKARPEVVIDVELLEVDRTRLREYGLGLASPGSTVSPGLRTSTVRT